MALPTCECVGELPQNEKLSAIYCALYTLAQGGGGGEYLQISQNLADVADPAAALANIGGAASGANTDITSLADISLTGGFSAPVTTKTDDYLATQQDYTILFDLAIAKTLNLPAVALNIGRVYVVKNLPNSADLLTIEPNGGELIDGATNTQFGGGGMVTIQSDGVEWHIINAFNI